jgi:hypothetical protein
MYAERFKSRDNSLLIKIEWIDYSRISLVDIPLSLGIVGPVEKLRIWYVVA